MAFGVHCRFSIRGRSAVPGSRSGVPVVRHGGLEGRDSAPTVEMDDAFSHLAAAARSRGARTHGEVIAIRTEHDRVASGAISERPYVHDDFGPAAYTPARS